MASACSPVNLAMNLASLGGFKTFFVRMPISVRLMPVSYQKSTKFVSIGHPECTRV